MSPASQSLVFTETGFSISASICFVLLVGWLCWLAWKRSGFKRATGLLEGLRFLVALGIAITLNQPEWSEIFKPDTKPELAILFDNSHSMETQDMPGPESNPGDPLSREDAAKPIADMAIWHDIAQKMDVTIEPFSSGESSLATPPILIRR